MILVFFNLDEIPGVQMTFINLINLASCIYYGGVQPFDTRFRRRIDLFNEYSILLITWHIMCYTDFVVSSDMQWLVGWSMILCICLNAFVNISIVLGLGGKLIYLVCYKYYKRYDRCEDNFCVRAIKCF